MAKADSASASANIASGKMNCSQSVLTAFGDELGLTSVLARKISMGFGGGMGRTGRTCGAVTGAYMVIGLKQDLSPENAQQVKERVYTLVNEFDRKFIEINGSTNCKDLLGYDLTNLADARIAKEKGLFTTLCPKLVHYAVEILDSME